MAVVVVGGGPSGEEAAGRLAGERRVIVGEVPLERLRHAVPPFPTRSKLWLALLEQAGV
jgi:threonine dehydrogenase-like Zn-dependent dehydrogenase